MIEAIDAHPLDQLRMLASYLVPAALIAALLNLRKLGRLRRAFDRVLNRSVGNLEDAKRFSAIGKDFAPSVDGDTSTHQSTIGLRALATALVALLAGHILPNLTDARGMFAAACLTVIGGYYLIFVWTYSVKVSGAALVVSTYALSSRAYPLDGLTEFEGDGAYHLRLFFSDGRRGRILRYVTGRRLLEQRLQHIARTNRQR